MSDRTPRARAQFDTNGDGTVDIEELRKALVSIGPKFLSTEECDELVEKIDTNHDGNIEVGEFVNYFIRNDLGATA